MEEFGPDILQEVKKQVCEHVSCAIKAEELQGS
jgi:hypothetical protein